MTTTRVVKTVDTWEVTCWSDERGVEQENWELVDQQDLPSPKRRYITETPQQRSERMSRTAKEMWRQMKNKK